MNYDQLNKIELYWRKKLLPSLSHQYTTTSFDDYLRRFAFLPSGKWLRDLEVVRLARTFFPIDEEKFVKKYKDHCVTYNAPMKPEDGLQRVIYQISPTLHAEMAIWIWVEYDIVQSYGCIFACYNNEEEYHNFCNEIWKMRKEGDTEEKPMKAGFAAALDLSGTEDVVNYP